MLQPKRTKYNKQQKGIMKGNAKRGTFLAYGIHGLKSLNYGWITTRQIESARVAATRYMKREGLFVIRIFADKPVTKKPQEVRMGKGKGNVEFWVAVINPGRILFEVNGVNKEIAKEALRLAANKLPVKTKIIMLPNLGV